MGVKGIMRPPKFSITNRKHTLFLEFNRRQQPSKKGWPIKTFWPIAAFKDRLPIGGIAGHSHWAAILLIVFFSIFTIPAALGNQKKSVCHEIVLAIPNIFR